MRVRTRHPRVLSQIIDDEAIIINLETGNYYSLARSGSVIWSAIEQAAAVDRIVADLSARYDASEETLKAEVMRLVHELQQEGLIEVWSGDDSGDLGASLPADGSGRQKGRSPFEPPRLEKYEDMRDLMLLDPVHEVDEEEGWPHRKMGASR